MLGHSVHSPVIAPTALLAVDTITATVSDQKSQQSSFSAMNYQLHYTASSSDVYPCDRLKQFQGSFQLPSSGYMKM
jgi:hypothetical protein